MIIAILTFIEICKVVMWSILVAVALVVVMALVLIYGIARYLKEWDKYNQWRKSHER